jgi:hypothetical protein
MKILLASGGQGVLFEKTTPWTPAKTFDYFHPPPVRFASTGIVT